MSMRSGAARSWDRSQELRKYSIIIDSRNRNFVRDATPSSYRVTLPKTYHNVTEMRIRAAQIPLTFFTFSSARGNTSLKVTLGATSNTITIADGNYTASSLCSAIQTALNTAFSKTFSVTVDPMTLRTSIICTSDPASTISVDTTAYTVGTTDFGVAYYLGFNAGVVTSASGAGLAVTSPRAINVNPDNYVLLSLGSDLDNVDMTGFFGSGEPRRCFAPVMLYAETSDYVTWLKKITNNIMSPPKMKLNTLDVSWMFGNGTLVDFNGAEHAFVLEITCSEVR